MIPVHYHKTLLLVFLIAGSLPAVFSQPITHNKNLPVDTAAYRQIKQRSALWNEAYNKKDSTTFYTLLDTAIIISSANGVQTGKETCKNICRKLYPLRPDITWVNEPVSIDISAQWQLAFETGNWTETWTEKGDSATSQIKGKYSMMWKYEKGDWYITSILFTPLQCTGSYCNKK